MIEEEPVSLVDAPARPLNMIEAINEALDITMARDPDIVILGEDVGYFGGAKHAAEVADVLAQDDDVGIPGHGDVERFVDRLDHVERAHRRFGQADGFFLDHFGAST